MRMKSLDAKKKPISTRTIVVAAKPLRFGNELTAQHLREMAWPENALPNGAFAKIAELLADGKRVVLTRDRDRTSRCSPVKITGPGQRATLSALLRDGFKAVTVRVNDVDGVGGFVLPGDRVDVVLTRQVDKTSATTDVVLQNARVLAVDQVADERTDKPAVAKAVTLEVDVVGAQKLSLSAIGRHAVADAAQGRRSQFGNTRAASRCAIWSARPRRSRRQARAPRRATVTVTRSTARQEYSVPIEDKQSASGHRGAVSRASFKKLRGRLGRST